jgi:hypothetical protein
MTWLAKSPKKPTATGNTETEQVKASRWLVAKRQKGNSRWRTQNVMQLRAKFTALRRATPYEYSATVFSETDYIILFDYILKYFTLLYIRLYCKHI